MKHGSEFRESANGLPLDPVAKEKKTRFYRAAEPLFQRFGFKKTTVEDICRSAGMSKRTFYELFRDKSDLFVRMSLWISEAMFSEWYSNVPAETSACEQVRGFVEQYRRIIQLHPVFLELMSNMEIWQAFTDMAGEFHLSPVVDTFVSILQRGMARGEFSVPDPDRTVWIVLAMLDSVFLIGSQMNTEEIDFLDDGMVSALQRFILTGLGGHHEH